MKKAQLFGFSLVLMGGLWACSSKGDGSVATMDVGDGNELTLCDMKLVGDTIDVPLSEWVEDCQLVRFENRDTAFFKAWWPVITENFIGIRQSGAAFKLFNRDGKFLADIGRVGEGPGEYTGSLYSEAIDEENKCIYLAPFFGSSKLLKYNMDGTFHSSIEIGESLNKPKISLNDDGSLTMVHLCFEGRNKIFAAHVSKDGKVKTFEGKPGESINPFDKDGSFVGFNNEIWAYQNVPGMVYMMMPNDTLYKYDVQKERAVPQFALSNKPQDDDLFIIPQELPGKFLAQVWGKGTIVVDKKTKSSHWVRLKNDKFGNMAAPFNFSNGYFFAIYETMQLADRIEKRLAESNCTDEDKKILNDLLASLDENDNSVMFIGKLKQ